MRKFLLKSLMAVSVAGILGPGLAPAHAQSDSIEEELGDTEIIGDSLGDEGFSQEEAPPKPEPPYPGSEEEGFSTAAPRPTPTPPPRAKERPKKVTDEGEYVYSTELPEVRPSGQPGVGQPEKTTKEGEYYFGNKPGPQPPSTHPTTERPIQTSESGEYHYPTEQSPQSGAASFRFGFFGTPDIMNPEADVTFTQIYGDKDLPVIFGDYEWRITNKIGRLGIKLTSGVSFASGNGQFLTPRVNGITEAREKFTFIMFPNQLTANYKFQYAENQVVVPWAEGGAGYFTFMELRDDGKGPKFGGSQVGVVAVGINILLDWMDRKAIRQLDNDYGINHVWLTGEYRRFQNLGSAFDFSSNVINGGIMVEF